MAVQPLKWDKLEEEEEEEEGKEEQKQHQQDKEGEYFSKLIIRHFKIIKLCKPSVHNCPLAVSFLLCTNVQCFLKSYSFAFRLH